MSNKIFSFLGFKFDQGVLKAVTGGLNDVRTSSVRAALGIDDINKRLKNLATIQSVTALGFAFKNTAGSIKNAVHEIKSAYQKFVDVAGEGDRIAKTSKMLGLTVEEYQVFSSAAKHSGMSVEELDGAFKKFNVTLGKARSGDKGSLKIFGSILPKGSKLSDFKDVSSVVAAVADSYTKLSTAEQKAFVSQELFGKSGQKISELFKDGSEGLWQAYKDFNENGGGFSEDGAKEAELFNDELQKTQEFLHSIKISVMQELFPTFIKMFREIRSYLGANGDELKKKLTEVGKAISSLVLNVLPKIPIWLDEILDFIDKIGAGNAATLGLLGYFSPVLVNLAILSWSIVNVAVKLFGWVFKIFSLLKGVKTVVWAVVTSFKVAATVVGGTFYAAVGGVLILFAEIASIVYQFYKNWDMWCSFVNHELTDTVVEWWNQLKAIVSWAADGIGGVFRNIGEGIRDFVMGGLDTIYGAVQKIKGFLSGLFGGFPDKVKSFFGIQDSINSNNQSSIQTLGASAAQAVQESRTTVTNRFAVDFKNMPRGVVVTPPEHGDFDYSRGYMLGGV